MADAALIAVRMLRRAIRNSRDHFIAGQHSCRSSATNKGYCCTAAKALKGQVRDQLASPRRDGGKALPKGRYKVKKAFRRISKRRPPIPPGAIRENISYPLSHRAEHPGQHA